MRRQNAIIYIVPSREMARSVKTILPEMTVSPSNDMLLENRDDPGGIRFPNRWLWFYCSENAAL